MSHAGYAKRQPITIYRAQKRGGKGRMATAIKEEDFVEKLWIANTHDTLLAFTSAGRVLWLRVHKIPGRGSGFARQADRESAAARSERKSAGDFAGARFPRRPLRVLLDAQRHGEEDAAQRLFASACERQYARSISTRTMALVNVAITDGSRDVLLFASNGKAVRFAEDEVRPMGRTAHGVRGIRLTDEAHVVSMIVAEGEGDILTATQRGFGKRTELTEYPRKGRGTQGVIAIQCSDRNGSTGQRGATRRHARPDADLESGHAGAHARCAKSHASDATRRASR